MVKITVLGNYLAVGFVYLNLITDDKYLGVCPRVSQHTDFN